MNTRETNDRTGKGGAGLPPDIRHLSPVDFARLGVAEVAYVRPVVVNGTRAYAIHGADGTPLALVENWQTAIGMIVQHEMTPVTLH